VVGDVGFETMVARKLLVKALAAHVVTEEHRMHGAGYVVREVVGPAPRGGTKVIEYALGEDRSLGALIVGKAERVAWRLDSEALAAGMRKELGSVAVGRPDAIAIDGVIDLGVVTLASGKLRFVYAIGAPPKGWLGSLVRACGIGVTPVVLVPKGHGAEVEAGLVIELDVGEQLGVKSVGRALAKAAEALRVEGEIEPWRRHDEEVVIDVPSQRVWVLGVPVSLRERPFRLLECLAKNAGHVTATKDLGMYVSTADAPDVTARKMKRVLEEQVKRALEAAGIESAVVAEIVGKLVVVEGRKGYRIGVRAKVI
jgi:hypothetical protein